MLVVTMQNMTLFINTDCSCQDLNIISFMLYQVLVDSGEDVHQDYLLLIPEAKVAVPTDWLTTLFNRLRHKDPKLAPDVGWLLDPLGPGQGSSLNTI